MYMPKMSKTHTIVGFKGTPMTRCENKQNKNQHLDLYKNNNKKTDFTGMNQLQV